MVKKKRRNRSLLTYILRQVMVLVLAEALVFLGAVQIGGVRDKLVDNAEGILRGRVNSTRMHLQNRMLNTWSNVDLIEAEIVRTAELLEGEGLIDWDSVDDSSENAQILIDQIAAPMISGLRTGAVNSIFFMLNTDAAYDSAADKPGIFVTDEDIYAGGSNSYQDLYLEKGSFETMRSLKLSSTENWRPLFTFPTGKYPDYIYQALRNGADEPEAESSDCGYWDWNDEKDRLIYTRPVRNSEGRVLGVLGTAVSKDTLLRELPSTEVHETGQGYYDLVIYDEDSEVYTALFTGSDLSGINNAVESDKGQILLSDQVCRFAGNVMAAADLELYSKNTLSTDRQWMLCAVVPSKAFYAFSNQINLMLMAATALMMILGAAGAVLISLSISRPINLVHRQAIDGSVLKAGHFTPTSIREIDHFLGSIERLNAQVNEDAVRLQTILSMSSVRIAAYDLDMKKNSLFLTDNFFEVLPAAGWAGKEAPSAEDFQHMLEILASQLVEEEPGRKVYHFSGRSDAYIELRERQTEEGHWLGVAEDVTRRHLERGIIEYERDHDTLTGLLNRGAFKREVDRLLKAETSERKSAALVMMDLDNLKLVNDTYGHSSGDIYIRCVARTITEVIPDHAVISRISGDEFNIFFYGFAEQEEIRRLVERMHQRLLSEYLVFDEGEQFHLSSSIGIAWCPDGGEELEVLQQRADKAMYRAKKRYKGSVEEYNGLNP